MRTIIYIEDLWTRERNGRNNIRKIYLNHLTTKRYGNRIFSHPMYIFSHQFIVVCQNGFLFLIKPINCIYKGFYFFFQVIYMFFLFQSGEGVFSLTCRIIELEFVLLLFHFKLQLSLKDHKLHVFPLLFSLKTLNLREFLT